MFGCFFTVFRSVATAILMMVVGFGLFSFLTTVNFRDNFLTAEFYNENLSDNDVYNRFYDEVLIDPAFDDTTGRLLGNVDIPQADMVGIAREIVPPDYLQGQVEGAVIGAIDYLNKETDTPEIFIELASPLDKVKPVLFSYMDKRIDELEDVPVTTVEELETGLENLYRTFGEGEIPTQAPFIEDPEALIVDYVDQTIAELDEVPASTPQDFENEIGDIYRGLVDGELPTHIPSIESLSPSERIAAYNLALQAVLRDPSIPDEIKTGLADEDEQIKSRLREADVQGALGVASVPLTSASVRKFVDDAYDNAFESIKDAGLSEEALSGLDDQRDVIGELLGDGEVKESLKVGARALVGPRIDEALDELREKLDDQERLDVTGIAAEHSNQDKDQFLEELDAMRVVIDRGDVVIWVSIVMVVVGTLLMMIVQFPRLASSFRWPGITLFLSGAIFLIVNLVLRRRLEDWVNVLIAQETPIDSPIPPALVNIVSDVLTSMASDVAGSLIFPSIIIAVVGLVTLLLSFFIKSLHIPFLSR